VGQCRVHTDPAQCPSAFTPRFRIDQYRPGFDQGVYAVHVSFRQDVLSNGVNEHNEEGALRKMEGVLKFLFAPDSCFMVVEAEQILLIIAKNSSAVDMSGNVKGSDDI
jgi:hypothetical protein